MILGISGFIGSGKGTVGDYLVTAHGWKAMSFASALKDAVSNIFCWPRDLLEGDTAESREWRELEDKWWTEKLRVKVTPRWALQHIGTDVLRNHFSDNIWLLNIERQILNCRGNIVITDVRFKNEMRLIRHLPDAYTVWIRKGQLPDWYKDAINTNTGADPDAMNTKWPNIHASEWSWVGQPIDHVIYNNGSLIDLYNKVEDLISDIETPKN